MSSALFGGLAQAIGLLLESFCLDVSLTANDFALAFVPFLGGAGAFGSFGGADGGLAEMRATCVLLVQTSFILRSE